MESMTGVLALVFTAALGGMRIAYGIDVWKGEERPFYRVWIGKTVYQGMCLWLLILGAACFLTSDGKNGVWPDNGYLYAARFMDLLATYVLLAWIDVKKRIVSDRVLVCYFLGQMLLGGVYMQPGVLLSCLIGGAVFTGMVILLAWVSRGKIGMGDAKLLGITAMTAGVVYTVQIVCAGLLFSFFYSLWLLLFRKMSRKAEIPFVPFLTLGMMVNTIYFVF